MIVIGGFYLAYLTYRVYARKSLGKDAEIQYFSISFPKEKLTKTSCFGWEMT